MSSSTVQNWGPRQGRYLVLVDEKTGEEIGRCSGFEWTSTADQDGTAAPRVRMSYDHNTKEREVSGPIKKLGFAQDWQWTMREATEAAIRGLQAELQKQVQNLHEQTSEIDSLKDKLVAVIRMLGGAVSISDIELDEAGGYVHEEAWSPDKGTVLNIVTKDVPF